MTTIEVANRLISLCRAGRTIDAIQELYDDNSISIEPNGSLEHICDNKIAIITKHSSCYRKIKTIQSIFVSEPIIAENYFSVNMKASVTLKSGEKLNIDEVCVYKVQEGKIVFEQFFYN